MISLMIADVWDETNALLLFQTWQHDFTLTEALIRIWTLPIAGLYRPLPLSVAFIGDSLLPFEGTTWYALRGLNITILLVSFGLLLNLARSLAKPSQPLTKTRETLLALAFFSSGSVMITAGWFANIFDAFTLFFILVGIKKATEKHWIAAFITLSLAFYCKEISALIFPFLFALCWSKKIPPKQGAILFISLLSSFCLYLVIRQNILPIGSKEDIHGFHLTQLPQTLYAWFESLWWQNTRREAGILGLVCSVLFFCSLKNLKITFCAIGAMLACTIIYLGMLPYEQDEKFTYLVFQSRLYLLPFVMLILIATVWGRSWSLSIVLMPILLGGIQSYTDYKRFQTVYAEIYQQAKKSDQTLIVDYPSSPLIDRRRNLKIGDYPNAPYLIDTQHARLIQVKP